jgi:hypothetical protein
LGDGVHDDRASAEELTALRAAVLRHHDQFVLMLPGHRSVRVWDGLQRLHLSWLVIPWIVVDAGRMFLSGLRRGSLSATSKRSLYTADSAARTGTWRGPRSCGSSCNSGRLISVSATLTTSAKLASEQGKACYGKRKETVEPVFGQLKEQQGARRFTRRGLAACDAEWKLLCGTHNLLKLWRHTRNRPAPAPTAG